MTFHKKTIAWLITLALLALLLPMGPAGAEGQPAHAHNQNCVLQGDVLGTGEADVFCLLALRDHILGETPLTGRAFIAANIDQSGEIDIFDMTTIRDFIFGVEQPQYICPKKQLDFNAQYVRTNAYNYDNMAPVVTVISSVQELEAYCEKNKEQYGFDISYTSMLNTSFLKAIENYTEAFFAALEYGFGQGVFKGRA